MSDSEQDRGGLIGKLRDRIRRRRERRAEKAHTRDVARREWERSGEVGRYGQHEGYSSGS